MSTRSSRLASRSSSRAASPSVVASASVPRRTVKSKAATPAPSEAPAPEPEPDDDLFQQMGVSLGDLGDFLVSPVAVRDAENVNAQAQSSPVSAPPTLCTEIAPAGSEKELLRIHHLLRSSLVDLQNLLSSNDARLDELLAPVTKRELLKLILNKKRVDTTRTAEMEQKDKVIQIREGTIKQQDIVIKASTVRANHEAQNKHNTDEAKQLRVRPPPPPPNWPLYLVSPCPSCTYPAWTDPAPSRTQQCVQEVHALKATIQDISNTKMACLREMAELKVTNVSLSLELRTDKDEYMEDLRTENKHYENDNMRMRTMVHMFHKLNPTLCPGCRGGPSTANTCKACNHILEVLASEA